MRIELQTPEQEQQLAQAQEKAAKERETQGTLLDAYKEHWNEMKDKPAKERLLYFFTYYRTPVIATIVILALLISVTHSIVTAKKTALEIGLVNAYSTGPQTDEEQEAFEQELGDLIGMDEKKYEIVIDPSLMYEAVGTTITGYSSQNGDRLTVLMAAQEIDLYVAPTDSFEPYAQFESFADLRNLLPAETLETLSSQGRIYYTDASTMEYANSFEYDRTTQSEFDVDHYDPSSMKDPIPVGVLMDGNDRFSRLGYYEGFLETYNDFQCHPQTLQVAVMVNSTRTEDALKALYYLMGIE